MKKTYIALCAIAIGKQIIQPGKPLPADVNPAKIKSLLDNNSIEEANEETTATLVGAVTKDGRVIELNKLSAAALKKLGTKLEIADAAQLEKDKLVEAILAIEFPVKNEE
jgi:hypothetical protein